MSAPGKWPEPPRIFPRAARKSQQFIAVNTHVAGVFVGKACAQQPAEAAAFAAGLFI
jgi:hypothetical protein